MSYATLVDLPARFRTHTDAQLRLDEAAATIDDYCAGTLVEAVGVTDRLRPAGGKLLYLGAPTTAVTAVQIENDPGPLASTAWVFHAERNQLERVDGSYWPGGAGTTVYYPGGGFASLTPMGYLVPGAWLGLLVTRTRGFNTGNMPRDLRLVNAAVAVRLLAVAPGVDAEQLGDYQVTYSRAGSVGRVGGASGEEWLTDAERRVLDKYRWNAAELTG